LFFNGDFATNLVLKGFFGFSKPGDQGAYFWAFDLKRNMANL